MLNAAIVGSPIGHSLSPVLHRAGYAALGLTDWRYAAHDVGEQALAGFLAGLDASWRGVSLTMPLKEEARRLADERSALVDVTGSANTLVRLTGGGWAAENTDVVGIERALAPAQPAGTATVLGSGATARSALIALHRLGVVHVRVAARNAGTGADVADLARRCQGMTAEVVPLGSWAEAADDLVVSTLPPAASESAAAHLHTPRPGTLLDVVYADWPTPLARAAAARGMTVVSGLEMLVHQAAAQFELFTGVAEAPLEAMFAAGRAALDQDVAR